LGTLGVPDEKIFVANEYPGVIYARVTPKPIGMPLQAGARCILYLGRFVEFKRENYLLEAFSALEANHPDTWLVLAGDGPLHDSMRRLARELGLTRVHFMGFVADPAEKSFLFRRASLLVVPSVRVPSGAEGGPLVVLEAMSAGLPILGTTALGSSTELIEDRVNGLVVPEQDSAALTRGMMEMSSRPIDRKEVLRSFACIRDHQFQAEQLERAIAYARHDKL
jgi:glycosyltransferase involved in cell wall biosynthesis